MSKKSSSKSNKNEKSWFLKQKSGNIYLFWSNSDSPLTNRSKEEFGAVREVRESDIDNELVVRYFRF